MNVHRQYQFHIVIFLLGVLLSAEEVLAVRADQFTQFAVYFSNDILNPDPTACGTVFPVTRKVPKTKAVARAALSQLFHGPMPAERAQGYHAFFSAQTEMLLKDIKIVNGTAYVDLRDLRQALSGATSSCGSAEFISQVNKTLKQFPTIKRAIYAIEGNPKVFYEWMELECDRTNDNCSTQHFRPLN